MREIPQTLQAKLDAGSTTNARCWRVVRSDGMELGFTDHDRALEISGLSYEPDSGFAASSAETSTGFAPGTHDVSGILRSARISEADLIRGLYDGAEVSQYLVDWTDPEVRVLLSRGLIGKIRRDGVTFEAEVTGFSDLLNRPFGRAYVHSCESRLGDAKCGIDLTGSAYRGTGSVVEVTSALRFSAAGLSSFSKDWFTGGSIKWTTGENAGTRSQTKSHLTSGGAAILETWLTPAMRINVGDAFTITAGCNKTSSACRNKFDNLLNFRGFPHMPGDDVAASYPSDGGIHDGSSLFR